MRSTKETFSEAESMILDGNLKLHVLTVKDPSDN